MKLALFAAVAALAPGPLLAGSFDLSIDETNGERIVAVSRSKGGAFAVASGGEDLRVLRGEAAEMALAKLATVEETGGNNDDEEKRELHKKKRIVIHKMTVDDGGVENTERVLKKASRDHLEDQLMLDFDEDDDETAEFNVKRTVFRMKGVDEAQAIKFIDETSGLDAGEKAEMKSAVAL